MRTILPALSVALFSLTACGGAPPRESSPPTAIATPAAAPADAGPPIYMDPGRPLDARVRDLVGRLTLAEKTSLLVDKSAAVEQLGIRKYDVWNEALHGVA